MGDPGHLQGGAPLQRIKWPIRHPIAYQDNKLHRPSLVWNNINPHRMGK
jgi:hypothetical protein